MLRTAVMLGVCALLLAGAPMPFDGLLLPIAMLFVGETEFLLHGLPRVSAWRMIAWRLTNTIIATTTLLVAGSDSWIVSAAFGLFIVSCSGIVGGRGLAVATVLGGLANFFLPIVVAVVTGRMEVLVPLEKGLLLSFLVLPSAGLLLHQRAHRLLRSQRRLHGTVKELEAAQERLQGSEQRLQQWNQQLNAAIDAQTAQLEERNRYLSIINAVSFALAEPMDDDRSLERAARLVARLLGARSAQGYHRLGDGDSAHLFVTVAPEDVHAPRLPEALLRRVADGGVPLISTEQSGPDLPDLGEPYAVVPISARGQVCGAFALLGTGRLTWGDQERHLLLLIGREMGASLENLRLYRAALDHVRREEVAGDAARILDTPGHRESAIREALHLVGEAVDAWAVALVSVEYGEPGGVVHAARHPGEARGPEATDEWLRPLLPGLTDGLDGQAGPLVLGAGGTRPLAEATEMLGIGTLVLVPVTATHGPRVLGARGVAVQPRFERVLSGVLVVAMAAGVPWRSASRELIESFADSLGRRLESDALVALQQQRIRELTGLAEVARTMQSGADVDRLYQGFAHALTGLVAYSRLYVARLDEFGQIAHVPCFSPPGGREDMDVDPRDMDSRWFTLRTATAWHPGTVSAPAFVRNPGASHLVVPMRPKGQVLGIVAFEVADEVTGDQLRIVEQAVEQLALALDSATLYHQATERASHIQALSNLARIVASVVDLREAFSAFAEEVRWLIPFQRAVMLLLDDADGSVQPYATYPEESVMGEGVPVRDSIASAVVSAGSAVLLQRSDWRYAHLDWDVFGPNVREVAAVPVGNGLHVSAIFALIEPSADGALPDLEALDEVAGLLGVTIERLRLYERAEYSANHDLLTGLPNYRYLQERLFSLRRGITEPGESSVLMIDMDGLKLFNDTLGHEAGDQVIRIVARELRASCRAEDFVARTGGDEFVVVMEGVSGEDAARAAARIHAAVHDAHLEVAGAPARIGVSIGIATAPHDAGSANRLLHHADQAMYAAKFSGGHRTRLASDQREDSRTRSVPQRDTHLVETLARTATDGASQEERQVIAVAQRWVAGVAARLPGGAEAAPWVRLLVARAALRIVAVATQGADQAIAREVLERLWTEWSAREDDLARAVMEVVPIALRIAAQPGVVTESSATAMEVALAAARLELGPDPTPSQQALIDLVLHEGNDRRQGRRAA